MIINVIMKHF